jgi:arsenite-transporting ATPase
VPRLTFFIGKGGVGKTTLSASYAARIAKQPKRKVLLVSTDPAHSLSDILDVKLASNIKRVPLPKANLSAWQINAESVFRRFLDERRKQFLALIESGTLFTAEEIEPLLDTALPGMAELGSLLALQDLVEDRRWTDIVIDTAPIGHTLRLFSLPKHFEDFLRFLDLAGSRDRWLTQRFGTKQRSPAEDIVADLKRSAEHMNSVLSSETSRVYLVTSPESFSLEQSVRSVRALRAITSTLPLAGIIVNRAVRNGGRCPRCLRRAQRTKHALGFLKDHFAGTKLLMSEDSGEPVIGTAGLARHAETVFGASRYRISRGRSSAKLQFKETEWPKFPQHLCFTVGKGGVGKTTVSASIAYLDRKRQTQPVTICSTDPAPSLDDVFQTSVGNNPKPVLGDRGLCAIEVDSVAEFRAWANDMQQKIAGAFSQQRGGITVDVSFDRQIFSALLDIVPPGIDEIFAIFKILDLTATGSQGQIVIDMAPTGHALELLRMPERIAHWTRLLLKMLAAHRTLALAQDVAVEIATLGQRVRGLLSLMQDSRSACAVAVTLPEPMPARQAEYLLDQMRGLGINIAAVMINRVLLDTGCGRCSNAQRWQQRVVNQLAKRRKRSLPPMYLLAEQTDEIAGKAALSAFTRHLHRLK